MHLGNVEFTENAQVKQHIIPVNSRIQGFIKEVRFDEYAQVKQGDTLALSLHLPPRTFVSKHV